MNDDIFNDRWHWCVLAAGFQAYCEGRLENSAYVKELAYRSYERGDFRGRVKPRGSTVSCPPRCSQHQPP